MKIKVHGITDVGLKRKVNQDAYLVDDALRLYVVADGMGGHRGGEVASLLATQTIQQYCQSHQKLPGRELLDKAVNASSSVIYKKSTENEELSGMGTTVLALLFQENILFIAQVGDSRAYLLRKEGIWQLTEDHSLLNEEIRSGRLDAAAVSTYQFKNVITRSVGYEHSVVVDIYRRAIQEGDGYLACSDGLSGLVEISEIHQSISKYGPSEGLPKLVELANERGGDDNITIVYCEVCKD